MKSGYIYVIITAVLFATFEPISKLIAADITPLAITAIRFLIAGLMLLPFSLREIKKQNVKLTLGDHLKMIGLGILFICASMVSLQYGVKLSTSPALIAILFSANSVITIFLSSIMLKEKITAQKLLALILCVAGILVCSWQSLTGGSGALSILLGILAALTFSFYTVFNKKMMKKASGNILISFSFIYGSILLFPAIFIVDGGILSAETLTVKTALIMLYIAVAVTGIGYWAYFKALEKGSATLASLAFFVKPALSPIAAAIFVKEMPTVQIFIGLILVLIGSYMVSYAGKTKATKQ